MTRNEFMEDILDWQELLSFCADNQCDLCDDIYSEDETNDMINNQVAFMIECKENWWTIREYLDYIDGVDQGCEYYRTNGVGDFDGLTNDDFEDYKHEVLKWMNDNNLFEEECDDEMDEDYEDEEELVVEEDDDYTVIDLFYDSIKELENQQKMVTS